MNEEEKDAFAKALHELFTEYARKASDPLQKDILNSGFAFSQPNFQANVLIMGINPSLRTRFLSEDGQSYDFRTTQSDPYFKKFHELLAPFPNITATYADLFYQKHSEQAQIQHFLKDATGKAFLKDQLKLTHTLITRIQPRLILLFNRFALQFFDPAWMPVTAIDEDKEALTKDLNIYDVQDEGNFSTRLYPSVFLGYRTAPKARDKVLTDVPRLLHEISEFPIS